MKINELVSIAIIQTFAVTFYLLRLFIYSTNDFILIIFLIVLSYS